MITKRDLDAQGAAIRSDIERLAVSTGSDIERSAVSTGSEFAAVRSEMSSMSMRIETVRRDVEARIEISGRQTAETLYKELAATTRTVVFACAGAIMTSSGLAFAAARF